MLMTKRMFAFLALWVGLAMTGAPQAKPLSYELPNDLAAFKPGPHVESAQNNCVACHSADYINFQPPKKGQAFWEAEVQKMIKVYHAPIDEKDATAITEYLVKTY
jgi:mono/diheme cytochrome c family protein